MNGISWSPGYADNLTDIYDNVASQPGAYNAYFNICGTDDPTATLGSLESAGPDMELVNRNVLAAAENVRARFFSLYFACVVAVLGSLESVANG